MYGRFTFSKMEDMLGEMQLEITEINEQFSFTPRYNIAPTQDVAVVVNTPAGTEQDPEVKRIEFFHWD